jgi:leucyl aminopeptidase
MVPSMSMPSLTLVRDDIAQADADVVAVPMRAGSDSAILDGAAERLGAAYHLELPTYLARASGNGRMKGRPGEILAVPLPAGPAGPAELLVVGIGEGSAAELRKAGAAIARRAKGRATLAAALPEGTADAGLQAHIEGLLLASYTFSRRSEPPSSGPVSGIALHVGGDFGRQAADHALVVAKAVWLARDLANTPSNEKDPAWLADRAREVAMATGLECRIWDETELRGEGFNGLLAVGSGSSRPPRLISLGYRPDEENGASAESSHVVLVGKGITFDSGGLSIKPREAMIPMKADMAGGAAVIAVLGALRELGVRHRVTGLVAAAENMPSGSAYRPSDVITQYGGTTVEVVNTDAEGRLVLADALAYADRNLDPDVIIDLATLTGAASLGLSRRVGALYATDDALAVGLVAAGEAAGDPLWRMPLVEDYRSALDSDIADICHVVEDAKVGGGSITAALFLREFVGGRRWAHLDIAGPGKVESEEHEITKGGTGFGVRALLRWLQIGSAPP